MKKTGTIIMAVLLGFVGCRNGKPPEQLTTDVLKSCEKVFYLPKGNILTLYRTSWADGYEWHYDRYLCLFNNQKKLVEQVPFWGQVKEVKGDTIFVRLYKNHPKNKNPFLSRSGRIGEYTVYYELYSQVKGYASIENKVLDSIRVNHKARQATLYYRLKPKLVESAAKTVEISELHWDPFPGEHRPNNFYIDCDLGQINHNYKEYYAPRDLSVVNNYFNDLLGGVSK